jgi:hypothetical protein
MCETNVSKIELADIIEINLAKVVVRKNRNLEISFS